MDGDTPAPGADRYNASGHVVAEGTKLRCFGISFTSTFDGTPAFVRWLSTEGCSDFLYELRPANAELDDLHALEEEP